VFFAGREYPWRSRAPIPAIAGGAIAFGWIDAQRPFFHARRNWLRFVI